MTTYDPKLDERYLGWLYAQVDTVQNRNPSQTYWLLAEALFKKEFLWFVPNDDNRVEDGRELRELFLDETGFERDQVWMEQGCSMLEMLVALARRIGSEVDEDPREWFWVMIDNISLRAFVDEEFTDDFRVDVEIVLDRIIQRTYDYDGRGGLFPLREPAGDQRAVEIWYQVAAYLMENNAI